MYGFGGIPNYLEDSDGPVDGRKLIKCWNLAGELPPPGLGHKKTDCLGIRGLEKVVGGTMGALGIYHKAVMNTTFAGPTYFAGVLRRFLH